jgi:O-antigen/teichoic acid export membrane protein
MSKSKLLRGTLVLTLGRVASYGLSFIRNIILARMLGKADFGLAAIFAMTLSLLEFTGRMSFGQQIIQAKEGDSEPFQATSHAFQFVIAVVGAILMYALSHPLAQAFKVPQFAWAFAILALVPLARGFEHLDYFRQQRELNFLPSILCDLVPQALITLAAWPLTLWLKDFRVIVWLMIGKAVSGILMTHLLAKRSYRWAWQQDCVKSMWAFGWPLLLNGLVIFASQQSDQLLVGAFVSLNDLAAYALAFSLVSIPWFVFAQVGASLMLPILSRVQDDPEVFRQHYRDCMGYVAVGAVTMTLPLIIAGEQLVRFFYGDKYTGTGALMALLGASFAARFLRLVPSLASMARSDTINELYSNLARGLSLPLAAFVCLMGGSVAWVAACALFAELIAVVVSVLRLRHRQGVPLGDTARAFIYVVGFLSAGLALVYFGLPHWNIFPATASVMGMLALSLLVAWRAFPACVKGVKEASRFRRVSASPLPVIDQA